MTYAEVIGDPIAHSKSPVIHGFWLAGLGIAAEYRKTLVHPAELAAHFAARRGDPAWRGCNVTLPHKEQVGALVDRVDPLAARIGAVNTVWRDAGGALIGSNTDVDGVAEAIGAVDPESGPACVIGAGGAARAALACLAARGHATVRVIARSPDKARAAGAACGVDVDAYPFTAALAAFDGAALLVNATQLGMTGQEAMDPALVDGIGLLRPGATVFDMVYAPLETALLAAARRHGLAVADGLTMLVGQAAAAFDRFFGQPPARASDGRLRELLTS